MFKKQNPRSKNTGLSQFGLLDVPGSLDDDGMPGDSDDDFDLEAELAAIGGGSARKRQKPKPVLPAANLDAMIAESLKDVPSDDDEVSGDEDDPDLLSELRELATEDEETPAEAPPRASRPAPPPPGIASAQGSIVNLLQERISMYTEAESNAKINGESSRARRFGRGLKTLNDLMKQARAGKHINDEDIPPVVSTGKKASESPQPASVPPEEPTAVEPTASPIPEELPTAPDPEQTPTPTSPAPPVVSTSSEPPMDAERQAGLQLILKRQAEFKSAALASKHAGDKSMALEYLKVAKQFDIVVGAYRGGQEMDFSELPTVDMVTDSIKSQGKVEEQTQQSSAVSEPSPSPAADASGSLITASSVEEALRQHLAVYKEQEARAGEQGNSSKQRRMGRIVKQYEQALKLHAAGRAVPPDLPTPLGYAPVPTDSPATAPSPAAPARAAPRPSPSPSPSPAPAPAPAPRASASRADKKLAFLMKRQREFKEAALDAKMNGDLTQAKEYLRSAKGFDSVIEAAKGGLLVDLKSLPLPPKAKQQLEDTFDVVSGEDCGPSTASGGGGGPGGGGGGAGALDPLHQQLEAQLKLCLTHRDHYRAMGSVAEANRFEHLAVSVKQDLDIVNIARSLGQEPPKFHYESRQFSVVQCNTDINENELELTIVRGVSYNVPNPREVDTYVKFEFPYPQDAPVSDRTALVKDTSSPQYGATFTLPIQRGARACQRVFKRHGIKFEVYSRGGWFSRDTLLGSLTVKLAPLESVVTVHEAFPLMEGRRPAGGSLEVRLRLRTPILQQQFENTTHRWLLIDN